MQHTLKGKPLSREIMLQIKRLELYKDMNYKIKLLTRKKVEIVNSYVRKAKDIDIELSSILYRRRKKANAKDKEKEYRKKSSKERQNKENHTLRKCRVKRQNKPKGTSKRNDRRKIPRVFNGRKRK